MENSIPTLYILQRDSSVRKSAKISTILCPSSKIKKNIDVLPWFTSREEREPAFSVYLMWNTSC